MLKYFCFFAPNAHCALVVALSEKKMQVPFSMAIGKGELMQECFLKHSRMGTTRLKYDKETDEEGKKRGASVERSPPVLAQPVRQCQLSQSASASSVLAQPVR